MILTGIAQRSLSLATWLRRALILGTAYRCASSVLGVIWAASGAVPAGVSERRKKSIAGTTWGLVGYALD
jgi:hypothetical protein